jgi:hypothetical protein
VGANELSRIIDATHIFHSVTPSWVERRPAGHAAYTYALYTRSVCTQGDALLLLPFQGSLEIEIESQTRVTSPAELNHSHMIDVTIICAEHYDDR